jgi:GNAT superfamily N-acetyltransferase
VVTSNVPPKQCNTPTDVKTDEVGDAGASPVGDADLSCGHIFIRVIKLKNILTEGRERSHGWMSPSGRMIAVDDTHMATAIQLIPNWQADKLDPMYELWKKGYLRVTYMYDGSLIAHNEIRRPNAKQLVELKNMALEGKHRKIVWDDGADEHILWSEQDVLQEMSKGETEFVGPDEVGYDYYDDLNRIERESGIRILRDKEVSTLALQNGKVVGALYVTSHPYEYSFDVIVDKAARGQGIGAKLIDWGLSAYHELAAAYGGELRLDVVNPWVEKYLLKKGLRVLQKIGDHTIMTTP